MGSMTFGLVGCATGGFIRFGRVGVRGFGGRWLDKAVLGRMFFGAVGAEREFLLMGLLFGQEFAIRAEDAGQVFLIGGRVRRFGGAGTRLSVRGMLLM